MTADKIFAELGVIATGIIGIAIIAVLVSKNADTSNVIAAAGKAFSGSISAATGPVTGGFTSFGF